MNPTTPRTARHFTRIVLIGPPAEEIEEARAAGATIADETTPAPAPECTLDELAAHQHAHRLIEVLATALRIQENPSDLAGTTRRALIPIAHSIREAAQHTWPAATHDWWRSVGAVLTSSTAAALDSEHKFLENLTKLGPQSLEKLAGVLAQIPKVRNDAARERATE